jgi:chloride channel protein, CIC family
MKIGSKKAAARIVEVSDNTRLIVTTTALSIASALASVAFLLLTGLVFRLTFQRFASYSKPLFAAASFITIMATSLTAGLLLAKVSPGAAGSGIPQFKAAYWKDLGYLNLKPVIVKFVAGVLSIGGGTSLGREGPTVFMGGGLASWLAGLFGVPKQKRRAPALVGASAGLSAAFNTPLAAIAFVLEEILGDFNARSIGKVVLSSVIGAFVVYAILGRQPSFSMPSVEAVSFWHYLLAPAVALVASLLGVVFQRAALALRSHAKGQKLIPRWLLPSTGAAVTWLIGITCFFLTGKLGVFGLGYQDLSDVLHGQFAWQVAGILVIAKLAVTIASYSSGGCGGIFSPLLFIGGLSGFFLGGLARYWLPLNASDLIVLSAVGMSCCLGTVVRAPLSSLLIVFEMTHQFALIPGLLIGMLISIAVSKLAGPHNFYDALLIQDGHELHKVHPPTDLYSWKSLRVDVLANPKPVAILNLNEGTLRTALASYPFRCFPVVTDGRIKGMLLRDEIEDALREKRLPRMKEMPRCKRGSTVKEVQINFINSPQDAMAVMEEEKLVGILTLHDLLRAQEAIAE